MGRRQRSWAKSICRHCRDMQLGHESWTSLGGDPVCKSSSTQKPRTLSPCSPQSLVSFSFIFKDILLCVYVFAKWPQRSEVRNRIRSFGAERQTIAERSWEGSGERTWRKNKSMYLLNCYNKTHYYVMSYHSITLIKYHDPKQLW